MSVRITNPEIRKLEEACRAAETEEDYAAAERKLLAAIEALEEREIKRLGGR